MAFSWEDKGDFNKAIEIDPRAVYYYFRGLAWMNKAEKSDGIDKSDLMKAIDDYTQAIEREPSLVAPFINRASCYVTLGELELALADYDKAIEITPDDLKALEARQGVIVELNKRKKPR